MNLGHALVTKGECFMKNKHVLEAAEHPKRLSQTPVPLRKVVFLQE